MFNKNNKWKSIPPKDTIENILSILSKEEIYPNIQLNSNQINDEVNIYSHSLSCYKAANISNGKGMSIEYSLASGLAEFIERLQTECIFPRRYNNQKIYEDEIYENENLKIPFINLLNGEVKYFLQNDLKASSSANGTASGNTIDEAMVHALCEINERYCLYLFTHQQLRVNNAILNKPLYVSKVEQIIQSNITFYDISLFDIPTVLMIVQKYENKNLIGLKIDCAQTIELAIERCMTEMFQGESIDSNAFSINVPVLDCEDFDPMVIYKIYSHCMNTQGWYPKILLDSLFQSGLNIKQKYYPNFKDNFEIIKCFLTQGIKYFGNLYIRDYSFLGFPTIKIVAENLLDISKDIPDMFNKTLLFYQTGLKISKSFFIKEVCHIFIEEEYSFLTKPNNIIYLDEKFSFIKSWKMDINKMQSYCLNKIN